MANVKLTELTAYTSPVSTDVLPIVDLVNNQTKKVTVENLLRTFGTGTAAAPSFSFSGDSDTGIYSPGANQFAVTTGGTQRLLIDASGNTTIQGDLTVNGTTTTVESNTLSIKDKNIEIAVVSTPTDTTADGGGITLKGASDKTINWVQSTGCWTFNQPTNFNNHVRIDSSGNVGVGTTSPAVNLHVNNSSSTGRIRIQGGGSSSAQLQFIAGGQTNPYVITQDTSRNLIFFDNATERLRIDSSGKVGIGVTPTAPLHVKHATFNTVALFESGDTQAEVTFKDNAGQAHVGCEGDALFFKTSSSGTEQMRIDSSGNVQIGPNGGARLTVTNASGTGAVNVADFYANAANQNPLVRILGRNAANNGTTSIDFYKEYQGGFRIVNNDTASSNYTSLEVAGSERMRINSSGNVGIGTSSIDRLLHIQGAGTSGTQVQIEGTSASAGLKFVPASGDNWELQATTNSALIVYNRTDTAERLRIDSSGNVGINETSPSAKLHVSAAYNETGLKVLGGGAGYNSPLIVGAASGTEYMRVDDDGRLLVGTTTEGDVAADNLTVADSGNCGMTIRSGSSSVGSIYFSDATSGAGEYAGYFQYVHSSNYLNIGVNGADAMRITSLGSVGIGITSPDSKLHVHSSTGGGQLRVSSQSNSEGVTLTARNDGNGSQLSARGTSSHLRFYTTNASDSLAEKMRIDSDGNVGIGTTSPAQKVELRDTSDVYLRLSKTGLNSTHLGCESSLGVLTSDGDLAFRTAGSGGPGNTERMRIDSSGNVGIGTTDPQTKLAVQNGSLTDGSILVGANYDGSGMSQNSDKLGAISFPMYQSNTYPKGFRGIMSYSSSAVNYLQLGGGTNSARSATDILFYTASSVSANGSERMRIDASGNVFVGRTSDSTNVAGISLLSSGKGVFNRDGNNALSVNRGSNDGALVEFKRAGTTKGSISISGSTTSYNTSSDYRLKENIVDLANSITRIKQLQPRRFNFTADAETTVDGFIAHETQTVVPEAVTGTHNEVDDDGNPVMQGIDQSKLVPLLTAALKEAIAKIETLETKVAALEAG